MENCKTSFSNKGNYGDKIKLVENEEFIDDDPKFAEELNNFFKTAVVSLDIHGNPYTVENVENMSDPVEKAIKEFEFHQAFFLSNIELAKTFLELYFVLT